MACMSIAAVVMAFMSNAARLAVNVPQLEDPDDDDAYRERKPRARGSTPAEATGGEKSQK